MYNTNRLQLDNRIAYIICTYLFVCWLKLKAIGYAAKLRFILSISMILCVHSPVAKLNAVCAERRKSATF